MSHAYPRPSGTTPRRLLPRRPGLGVVVALWCLCSSGCGHLPDPPYHFDRSDPAVAACVDVCREQRQRCEGRLARAYQRCVQRHPGNVLEQNRCFDQAGPQAVLQSPGVMGTTCNERFDHCFVFACGGERVRDDLSGSGPLDERQ